MRILDLIYTLLFLGLLALVIAALYMVVVTVTPYVSAAIHRLEHWFASRILHH